MKPCTHPWHCIEPGEEVPVYVKRVPFSSVHYPANYGFIPQTYCDDHDPLDILVICSIDVFPMCIVEAKVIGAMEMIDENEKL